MKYRIAKLCDMNDLVDLHYDVRNTYPVGIFSKLSKSFLRQYYKIILNDKYHIVICAEDTNDKIIGFCSATINVKKYYQNLLKNKKKILISALSSILFNPSVIMPLMKRYNFMRYGNADQYTTDEGARGEFWVWSRFKKDPISSIKMHEIYLKILKTLGVKFVNFEVDSTNQHILKYHRKNGAETTKILDIDECRTRYFMRYNLDKRFSKI